MGKYISLLVLLIWIVFAPAVVLAESYDVTATVHAPMPAGAPVITGPVNLEQESSRIFVSGTCEVVSPAIIVVLVRDGETIGSANCLPDGSFKIYVALNLGENIIYPKYLSITGLSSAFGNPIVVTYQPRISTAPANPNTSQNTIPNRDALSIGFDYDFVAYNDLDLTKLKYTISGGKPPYDVAVSWGDDSITKYRIESPSEQSIEHQFTKILPPSQLTIQATDSVGEKTSQSRALVSFRKGVFVPAGPIQRDLYDWSPIWYAAATGFVSILLFLQIEHNRINAVKKTKTKPRKQQLKLAKLR